VFIIEDYTCMSEASRWDSNVIIFFYLQCKIVGRVCRQMCMICVSGRQKTAAVSRGQTDNLNGTHTGPANSWELY